jgi:hypothetical protein
MSTANNNVEHILEHYNEYLVDPEGNPDYDPYKPANPELAGRHRQTKLMGIPTKSPEIQRCECCAQPWSKDDIPSTCCHYNTEQISKIGIGFALHFLRLRWSIYIL